MPPPDVHVQSDLPESNVQSLTAPEYEEPQDVPKHLKTQKGIVK